VVAFDVNVTRFLGHVHQIDGPDAWRTDLGREPASGTTGEAATFGNGDRWRVWVGEAGDPFWLDAVAAKVFLDGVLARRCVEPDGPRVVPSPPVRPTWSRSSRRSQ
jgi:hypothetical protein